jgi:uncharacterized protein
VFVPSRYLLLGKREYAGHDGRRARLAYSARMATLFALDPDTAVKLETGSVPSIPAAQQEALQRLLAIVPAGQDELAEVLAGYREGSADAETRGFTIAPSSYCNMACSYCGQEHFRSAVEAAKVERLARRVLAAFDDPRTGNVIVTWFGGEPLLALRVVRELSARFVAAAAATGKTYSARMATNGSLLKPATLAELHLAYRLASIEVTIDGPGPVHDRRRLRRDGSGSYDHIVAVLAGAAESLPGLQIVIRCNVDSDNVDTVPALITDLARAGLARPQVQLSLVPVHSWGNDVSNVELGPLEFARRETGWLRLARSLGFASTPVPSRVKRITCRATSVNHEILDLAGQVYSCSEHPLVPGARETGVVARLADLPGSAPRPAGMFGDWYDEVGEGKPDCARCPFLPVCGGACPKLWREGHNPCPSYKFNWGDRIDLAAAGLGYASLG